MIWKFILSPLSKSIPMPEGAKVLTVATQNDHPYVWAAVDPTRKIVQRKIVLVATGDPVPREPLNPAKYLGTVHDVAGWMVFHIFDLGEQEV
jgi:hypothetical protein